MFDRIQSGLEGTARGAAIIGGAAICATAFTLFCLIFLNLRCVWHLVWSWRFSSRWS